jgi:hypothetical protein
MGNAHRGRRKLVPEGLTAASLLPTSPTSITHVLHGIYLIGDSIFEIHRQLP